MASLSNATAVQLMGFDVDGVMTDGTLYYSSQGDEMKAFSCLDGLGLKMLRQAGIEVVIISGRRSVALQRRAQDLGIDALYMGIDDKYHCMQALLQARQLNFDVAGYMGDDLIDAAVLDACAFSAAPANAIELIRQRVDWISPHKGGEGAVRTVCDYILRAQNKLAAFEQAYLVGHA